MNAPDHPPRHPHRRADRHARWEARWRARWHARWEAAGLDPDKMWAQWQDHHQHHARGPWQAHMLAHAMAHRHGYWHHRALRRRFRHSLGARLTLIFLALGGIGCAAVYLATRGDISWVSVMLVLPLLTLLAYGGIRHLLQPLRALAHGAAAFGRGELSHRIFVHHRDEIGDLARRFNRMADDIQAMLDAKRELLLAISHELRSPLTRARLNAELIDEGGPQQAAVVKELGLMRDLIEDLLERERLDAGHDALRAEVCDPRALIQALLDSRFSEALGKGLVHADLSEHLPASMQLDRSRMQVLLGNLLDNALRHHDASRGAVQLSASATRRTNGQTMVRIIIRDLGPGVPEEALSRLGEPFFRPDAARTRDSGGVGLGLSLCRLIAQAHGGTLVLRNAEPGLEATVELPVVT